MKSDVNPMQSAHTAPRCTAHSKRSGILCKNSAVRGWTVCRMHGAGGGHKSGQSHPQYQHGGREYDVVATQRLINALVKEAQVHLEYMEC